MDRRETGDLALLSVDEMYAADKWAVQHGVSGANLMEAAGRAVAWEVLRRWPRGTVAVLCGPGNNGGDGFVAARHLQNAGWDVRLGLLGDRAALKGDAAWAASQYTGAIAPLDKKLVDGADVVIDALFGAGLNRALEEGVAKILEAATQSAVVAVDIPSGINGDSGQIMGHAIDADVTVTFFRRKTGHLLYPGRAKSGDVVVADIGIEPTALGTVAPMAMENGPALWLADFQWSNVNLNKFSRGFAFIAGGQEMTGAARLAVRAAQRCGAGYVLLASPEKASTLYRVSLESVVVKGFRDTAGYSALLGDDRINACLIGPGLGNDFGSSERVLATLRSGKPCVLDADAMTLFRDNAEVLLSQLHSGCILTPHEGEFSRVFADLSGVACKLSRARLAAQRAGCVVLLKGPDTVIASPDGRAVINTNASADLATAGTGDVLAGAITGLLSSTGDPFLSGAIGAWLHGEAARQAGPGLIAEDLNNTFQDVLKLLKILQENQRS